MSPGTRRIGNVQHEAARMEQIAEAEREHARRMELFALLAVERAARRLAGFTHGNLFGDRYRDREEAREVLLDALSQLDHARGAR